MSTTPAQEHGPLSPGTVEICLEVPRPSPARASTTEPGTLQRPRRRWRSRGGTSFRGPAHRAPSGTTGRVLPAGRGWGVPAPSQGLASGRGRCPGPRRARPGAQPWGTWSHGPGAGPRPPQAPGPVPGRGLQGWPRGSSPVRWSCLPLAGRAHNHGPMTTRPNLSRPGPRNTTEGEHRAALLLSPLSLQQQLPGSTKTPPHLSFAQPLALLDRT